MESILDLNSKAQREEYERYISANLGASFTQSLRWTKIKKKWSYEVVALRDENGFIIASALVLIRKIPLINRTMLYAPRGPVFDFHNKALFNEFLKAIDNIAQKYNAVLFKCDPLFDAGDKESENIFLSSGFIAREDLMEGTVQCKNNYMLDIKDKSESEVFASFHSKCRYNIRLAARKGVECEYYTASSLPSDVMDEFYSLMIETGKRDGFMIRSEKYLKEFIYNLSDEYCRLYVCRLNGRIISGSITVQYAGKTSYVYGASASDHEARSSMPNYLMQWNMIKWAIENNNEIYDFQGIPYYYDETNKNYGVYKFKKGFNGFIKEYAGEFDKVYSPVLYKLLNFAYKAKKFFSYYFNQIKKA